MAFQDDLDKLKNFSDGLPTGPLKDLAANGVGFAEKLGPTVKALENNQQGIGLGNPLANNVKLPDPFTNATTIAQAKIARVAKNVSVNKAKSDPLRITINNGFYERKNVMHSLASYTYNFELYILTYEDYNQFVNDPTFNIKWPLPISSISEHDNNLQFFSENIISNYN